MGNKGKKKNIQTDPSDMERNLAEYFRAAAIFLMCYYWVMPFHEWIMLFIKCQKNSARPITNPIMTNSNCVFYMAKLSKTHKIFCFQLQKAENDLTSAF